MKRILVTGGTGFFGRALMRYWHATHVTGVAHDEIVVLTRSPEAFLARFPEFREHAWLRFVRGNVLEPSTLPAVPAFTHLLHAATDSTLGAQLVPLQRFDQIVTGTRHVLDFAVAQQIPRLLFVSSGGGYGPQPIGMEQIAEEYHGMPDPLDPQQAYSVAKRSAEHLCALYHEQFGLETVIARCFAFVGRDLPLDAHFAIGNFIRDALHAPEIVVGGDGSPVRSYMDQRDLAHWLMTLLERGHAGQAFNVGSDVPVTIGEVATLVRDLLAPDKSVRIAGDPSRQGLRSRYVPSIAKARNTLGLTLTISLAEAIRDTAAHTP